MRHSEEPKKGTEVHIRNDDDERRKKKQKQRTKTQNPSQSTKQFEKVKEPYRLPLLYILRIQ